MQGIRVEGPLLPRAQENYRVMRSTKNEGTAEASGAVFMDEVWYGRTAWTDATAVPGGTYSYWATATLRTPDRTAVLSPTPAVSAVRP